MILNTSSRSYARNSIREHDTVLIYTDRDSYVLIRSPFVYAVCQCAGLDSRGFNTRYRGDCCSLSACSTQPNDRISFPPSAATVRETVCPTGHLLRRERRSLTRSSESKHPRSGRAKFTRNSSRFLRLRNLCGNRGEI